MAPMSAAPTAAVDVPESVEATLEECLRRAAGPGVPADDLLDEAVERWIDHGVALETVLASVHEAIRARLRTAPDHPGDTEPLDQLRGTLDLLDRTTARISGAYLRRLDTAPDQPRPGSRTFAAALLAGTATTAVARQCGYHLADEYWILAVGRPRFPAAPRPGVDPRVWAGRVLRALDLELARQFPGRGAAVLSADGGTLLLPAADCDDADLEMLVRGLTGAAEPPLTVVALRAATAEIPADSAVAHDMLDIALRLGLPARVHRFGDLALEYQLTRPGPGLEMLAALLDPLDDQPELLETLGCHIATGLNRKRTSRLLHLHVNSIDYRLRRIAALTGLEAGKSDGLWYLRSAYVAHSYRQSTAPFPCDHRITLAHLEPVRATDCA